MALTVQTAQQAGQIAATILTLEALVAQAQVMVAAGAQIDSAQISVLGGGPGLTASLPLSQADSATILNGWIAIATDNLATLNAALTAM